MNSKMLLTALVFTGGLVFTSRLGAQNPGVTFPAASPACTLKQRVGLTDVEIVYSRPGVKNRTIFGGIVPYRQVWRTGANASTKISFSTAVKLNGTEVPAGNYALYTIPDEKAWTVIIHKDTAASIFNYNPTNDLVRFQATPLRLAEPVETFTIDINDIRDESATLNLVWEKTRVPVKIEINLVSKLAPQIEAAMASPDKKQAGFYFQAATFYYNHDLDLKQALDWVNTGLADNPRIAYELLHLKAQILAKQGDKAGAIAAAKQSSDLAVKAEGPGSSFVKMNQDLIARLQP